MCSLREYFLASMCIISLANAASIKREVEPYSYEKPSVAFNGPNKNFNFGSPNSLSSTGYKNNFPGNSFGGSSYNQNNQQDSSFGYAGPQANQFGHTSGSAVNNFGSAHNSNPAYGGSGAAPGFHGNVGKGPGFGGNSGVRPGFNGGAQGGMMMGASYMRSRSPFYDFNVMLD